MIVQSKQSLLHHEAACPALKVDVSKPHPFSDRNQNTDQQQTYQDTEKDIVLTQPLGPYNHREDNVSYAAVVNSPARGNPTHAILTTNEDNVNASIIEQVLNNAAEGNKNAQFRRDTATF